MNMGAGKRTRERRGVGRREGEGGSGKVRRDGRTDGRRTEGQGDDKTDENEGGMRKGRGAGQQHGWSHWLQYRADRRPQAHTWAPQADRQSRTPFPSLIPSPTTCRRVENTSNRPTAPPPHRPTHLVECDVPIRADPAEEQVNPPSSTDGGLVVLALFVEVFGLAVENVRVLRAEG